MPAHSCLFVVRVLKWGNSQTCVGHYTRFNQQVAGLRGALAGPFRLRSDEVCSH